ncbi:MAG: undecaprenyldiphospho-muramoylpentapeptide beta-N-acetylglucosaminyltransferase [Acidimicrobiales bacterium]
MAAAKHSYEPVEGVTGRRGTYAVIAGGGTGGHVLPAVAVARALGGRGHPPEAIHFVGSKRGMEATIVPEAGFSITLLPGRGVARRLSLASVSAVIGLMAATAGAVVLLGRRRPSVVLSVGGYASLPCAIAARVWRIPLVVAEQNAVPGLANRFAARRAAAVAAAFEGTALPNAVVTGNPLRPEMAAIDRGPGAMMAARRKLGLPVGGHVIVAAGGSLGSRRINLAVVALAQAWRGRSGFAIRHVIGERDFAEVSAACPTAVPGGLVYQQLRFEQRMDLAYAAADLAVHRAGAGSIFELAAAGLPAILVPLPGAPGDHQAVNARRVAEAGAAVVVDDRELDSHRLADEIDALVADLERLAKMGEAARRLARPDAADQVAALVEAEAR